MRTSQVILAAIGAVALVLAGSVVAYIGYTSLSDEEEREVIAFVQGRYTEDLEILGQWMSENLLPDGRMRPMGIGDLPPSALAPSIAEDALVLEAILWYGREWDRARIVVKWAIPDSIPDSGLRMPIRRGASDSNPEWCGKWRGDGVELVEVDHCLGRLYGEYIFGVSMVFDGPTLMRQLGMEER